MRLTDLCPAPLPSGLPLPEEVHIGDVRHRVDELLERFVGDGAVAIADPDTWAAAGLGGSPHLLERHPHADDATVDRVARALDAGPGCLAVGSGTVNDLCKRAATLRGQPFVVFGTAASMNGYASGIAAILSSGLKTTVESRPARAVVLDTGVLAAAPAALTRAGLGDLISKPVSDSDWWLADQLEGGGYSDLPNRIVDTAVRAATLAAPGLAARDPAAHAELGRALVLSGVAMVAAGSSAPASGGEHLISHLWDMEAHQQGREARLHGAQVGVTTCISAALYQALLRAEPRFTEPPRWDDEAARIREAFGSLAEVILPQAERKHARATERVATLRGRWAEIRDGLGSRDLPTPDEVRAPLLACGAPSTLDELGDTRDNTARVFRLARDIRDRVTVLDVAFEIGVLPGSIDAVLDASGV